MLFSDEYFEPSGRGESNLRERGSRFLGYVFPVYNESDYKKYLNEIKQQYPDATHHCYAVVMHPDQSYQRSTDDGEPSNTAGKPILRAIIAAGLTNVMVVVVRYFGGTQLGIPGLINAFGETARTAIQAAGKLQHFVEDEVTLEAAFENEQEIYRMAERTQSRIVNREYSSTVKITLKIRRSLSVTFKKNLTDFPAISLING
jgi:uncharacterized YigZ family protein